MRVTMTAPGPLLKKPAERAASIILLATAPDELVDTSLYWSQTKPAQPSTAARDRQAAAALWEASEELVGLT
jgi:hypothetical protein